MPSSRSTWRTTAGRPEMWSDRDEQPQQPAPPGLEVHSLKPGDKVTVVTNPLRDGKKGGLFVAVDACPTARRWATRLARGGGPINVPGAALKRSQETRTMNRSTTPSLGAALLAASALRPGCITPARCSIATSRSTITGTVTEFNWTNPHASFKVDVPNAAGKVESWAIEMNSPNNLVRDGWKRTTIKAGDKVTVKINPLRDGRPAAGTSDHAARRQDLGRREAGAEAAASTARILRPKRRGARPRVEPPTSSSPSPLPAPARSRSFERRLPFLGARQILVQVRQALRLRECRCSPCASSAWCSSTRLSSSSDRSSCTRSAGSCRSP